MPPPKALGELKNQKRPLLDAHCRVPWQSFRRCTRRSLAQRAGVAERLMGNEGQCQPLQNQSHGQELDQRPARDGQWNAVGPLLHVPQHARPGARSG